ncbi:MAG: endonuclease V [Thermoleophilaceae bacterium]
MCGEPGQWSAKVVGVVTPGGTTELVSRSALSGRWPRSAGQLMDAQRTLACAVQPGWPQRERSRAVGACFVCFPRGEHGPGAAGDPGWAGAAVVRGGTLVSTAVVPGVAGAPYEPGLLALREGPLLEAAVRALDVEPDVLLVDATGRDHPRRAGLALQLGAVLGTPTIGVTHRLLLAEGTWPRESEGSTAPFRLGGDIVGHWVRTRRGARPLAVHAGWGVDTDRAAEIVLGAVERARTPEPLRQARRVARTARAKAG